MSRGVTAFEISWRGSLPVETVLRLDFCYCPRVGESGVSLTAEVSVGLSVKSALGQNACPDSGSGLDLRLSRLKQNSLRICSSPSAESKLLFVDSLSTASFVS